MYVFEGFVIQHLCGQINPCFYIAFYGKPVIYTVAGDTMLHTVPSTLWPSGPWFLYKVPIEVSYGHGEI